ncbi:MAG: hypothetical protein IPK52_18565 [Chloroflexi bacterium]|nr:hypothetical protein [Chloroflexota bacterium]
MRRFFPIAMLFSLTALLLIVPTVGAQAPRAPSNDDFAGATPITIGLDYQVNDIHESTVEISPPPMAGCGGPAVTNYTVWYSLILPDFSTVSLSTGGSKLIYDIFESIDTKLSVYTGGSLQTLTEVACSDDFETPYAELTFNALADTNYYIMVGTYHNYPMLPGSVLKLKTRAVRYDYSLPNGTFETGLGGADWKVTNSTDDEQICGNGSYPPHAGSCAFRFIGNFGENTRLKHSKPLPTTFAPRAGALAYMYLYYYVLDDTLGSTKIKFKVSYSDGTPTSLAFVNLTGTAPMAGYQKAAKYIELASKNVAKVQYQVDFKSTTGVLMIDSASFVYYSSVITREAALALPAPVAAR